MIKIQIAKMSHQPKQAILIQLLEINLKCIVEK